MLVTYRKEVRYAARRAFDPANTTPNTRLNKDPRFTPVNPNEASEHGEPIQDMVGESWPATIDVKWETPINGRFDIIGEGFKGGSTVKLFADGIAAALNLSPSGPRLRHPGGVRSRSPPPPSSLLMCLQRSAHPLQFELTMARRALQPRCRTPSFTRS